jgi:hypothetical protein
MTKTEIIDRLLIDYDVWECGYSRPQLENCSKKELELWLKSLKVKKWKRD